MKKHHVCSQKKEYTFKPSVNKSKDDPNNVVPPTRPRSYLYPSKRCNGVNSSQYSKLPQEADLTDRQSSVKNDIRDGVLQPEAPTQHETMYSGCNVLKHRKRSNKSQGSIHSTYEKRVDSKGPSGAELDQQAVQESLAEHELNKHIIDNTKRSSYQVPFEQQNRGGSMDKVDDNDYCVKNYYQLSDRQSVVDTAAKEYYFRKGKNAYHAASKSNFVGSAYITSLRSPSVIPLLKCMRHEREHRYLFTAEGMLSLKTDVANITSVCSPHHIKRYPQSPSASHLMEKYGVSNANSGVNSPILNTSAAFMADVLRSSHVKLREAIPYADLGGVSGVSSYNNSCITHRINTSISPKRQHYITRHLPSSHGFLTTPGPSCGSPTAQSQLHDTYFRINFSERFDAIMSKYEKNVPYHGLHRDLKAHVDNIIKYHPSRPTSAIMKVQCCSRSHTHVVTRRVTIHSSLPLPHSTCDHVHPFIPTVDTKGSLVTQAANSGGSSIYCTDSPLKTTDAEKAEAINDVSCEAVKSDIVLLTSQIDCSDTTNAAEVDAGKCHYDTIEDNAVVKGDTTDEAGM